MVVSVSSNLTFEGLSMCRHNGKYILKGSIFFPLKVAPMRIANNFKGH